jgi:hypothetical protein
MRTSKVSTLTFEKKKIYLGSKALPIFVRLYLFWFSCCANGKHVFINDCYTSIFLYMKLNSYNGDPTVGSARPIIINVK